MLLGCTFHFGLKYHTTNSSNYCQYFWKYLLYCHTYFNLMSLWITKFHWYEECLRSYISILQSFLQRILWYLVIKSRRVPVRLLMKWKLRYKLYLSKSLPNLLPCTITFIQVPNTPASPVHSHEIFFYQYHLNQSF